MTQTHAPKGPSTTDHQKQGKSIPQAEEQAPFAEEMLTTPERIMVLQRMVGNQAVMRYLSTPKPTIQRATGLAQAASRTSMTSSLTTWVGANGTQPLSALAQQLVTFANAELTSAGVPNVLGDLSGPANVDGQFRIALWTIQLNPAAFTSNTGITQVDQLTDDEIANIADTVYHEARHAEQWFRVAQYLRGQGRTRSQIRRATGITNNTVLSAAIAAPLTDPGPTGTVLMQERFGEAQAWHQSIAGDDSDYRSLVFQVGDAFDTLADHLSGIADQASFTAAQADINTAMTELNDVFRPRLEAEVTRLEAITSRSPVQDTMLQHARQHITHIDVIVGGWDSYESLTSLSSFTTDVVAPTTRAQQTNFQAYIDLPEEADAWDVGTQINTETATALATPPSAPSAPSAPPAPSSPSSPAPPPTT